MLIANFIAFWMLVTWAISRGDLFGILLGAAGFLIMHTLIEETHELN